MKIAFYTLGCKVNQLETEALTQQFMDKGYEIAPFSDICDLYVINTCTVTAASDHKCRQAIRRAKKSNPAALVAVTGCYSQLNPGQFAKMAEVDIVTGTNNRMNLLNLVEEAFWEKEKTGAAPLIRVTGAGENPTFEELAPTSFYAHTRGSVKIQDGCENFCSYCVIPYARGPVRSMDFTKAVDSIGALVKKGFSEIVLTGIQISSYGKGTEHNLLSLLQAAEKMQGDFRIRLGSLNPTLFTPEFIEALASLRKLCPHFHISLQSGCDRTLARMNRRYTAKEYAGVLTGLRGKIKNVAVTTDVIVGFPGESEEDFFESLAFVSSCGFLNCHVFPYSKREGTVAAALPGQLSKAVKEERARVMAQAAKKSRSAFFASQTGKTLRVLFETEVSPHVYEGYSENYIPVRAESQEDLKGKLLPVVLKKAGEDFCEGKLL